MKQPIRLLFSAAVAFSAGLAFAAPVVTSPLQAPLPLPYDESADAHAAVAAALERARAAHKHVLLDFGGNWCPDCRIVAGILDLPEVRPAIGRTFELALVDVGRLTRNLDIAQRYGVTIRAVPTMLVLDENGKLVNAGNPSALSDARSMSPQAVVDTIFGWVGQER